MRLRIVEYEGKYAIERGRLWWKEYIDVSLESLCPNGLPIWWGRNSKCFQDCWTDLETAKRIKNKLLDQAKEKVRKGNYRVVNEGEE